MFYKPSGSPFLRSGQERVLQSPLCSVGPRVTERFATSRYYCLMPVYARLGLTLMKRMLDEHANTDVKSAEKIAPSRPFSADDLAAIAGTLQAFRR